MLFGGLLAFSMEVAEFMVVTFASSLTLAIVGVVKVIQIYYIYSLIIISTCCILFIISNNFSRKLQFSFWQFLEMAMK